MRGGITGPKETAARTGMITLRNRARESKSGLQGVRLSARARKRPAIPRHTPPVDQSPNIEPFLGHLSRNVEGEAAIARHGKGARENIRNGRQAIRMHPLFVSHVVLNLRRHPCPSQQAIIITKGSGVLRTSSMRENSKFRRSQESIREFVRIRKVRRGSIITGQNRISNRVDKSGPRLLPDGTGAQSPGGFRHQTGGNMRSHIQKR